MTNTKDMVKELYKLLEDRERIINDRMDGAWKDLNSDGDDHPDIGVASWMVDELEMCQVQLNEIGWTKRRLKEIMDGTFIESNVW